MIKTTKSKILTLTIFTALFLFNSCTPPVKITQDYKDIDYPFGALAGKTICVETTYLKNGSGFERSIKREYNNDRFYIDSIENQIRASLATANVSSPDLNSSEREVNIIQKESVNSSEKAALFSQIKANSKADYLMILSSVTVNQEVTHNSHMSMNANGTMTPTNSSEVKCIVTIDVEMWDVTAQSKVLEFTSHGDEKVIFFATDAALRNATAASVENLSNYVLTGKM